MCAVLQCILDLCLQPGTQRFDDAFLKQLLKEFWEQDRLELQKFPTGRFPRRTKEEYSEIWEKWSNAWKETH